MNGDEIIFGSDQRIVEILITIRVLILIGIVELGWLIGRSYAIISALTEPLR